jgi:hypothetical protein
VRAVAGPDVLVDVWIELARTLAVLHGGFSLARCLPRTLLGLRTLALGARGALVGVGLGPFCGELTGTRLVTLFACTRAKLLASSRSQARQRPRQ